MKEQGGKGVGHSKVLQGRKANSGRKGGESTPPSIDPSPKTKRGDRRKHRGVCRKLDLSQGATFSSTLRKRKKMLSPTFQKKKKGQEKGASNVVKQLGTKTEREAATGGKGGIKGTPTGKRGRNQKKKKKKCVLQKRANRDGIAERLGGGTLDSRKGRRRNSRGETLDQSPSSVGVRPKGGKKRKRD